MRYVCLQITMQQQLWQVYLTWNNGVDCQMTWQCFHVHYCFRSYIVHSVIMITHLSVNKTIRGFDSLVALFFKANYSSETIIKTIKEGIFSDKLFAPFPMSRIVILRFFSGIEHRIAWSSLSVDGVFKVIFHVSITILVIWMNCPTELILSW